MQTYLAYSRVNYTTKLLNVEYVRSYEGVIKGMYIVTHNVDMHACVSMQCSYR